MTIYYLCPDYPHPSGGVRVIYRHVECLLQAGIDACVLQEISPFRPAWFESAAEVRWLTAMPEIRPSDPVVVPENYPRLKALGAGLRPSTIFIQNPFYIGTPGDGFKSWIRDGIETIIAGSFSTALTLARLGVKVDVTIPCVIDRKLFRPRAKKLQIATIPRKRPKEALAIRAFFEHLADSSLAEAGWVDIVGESELQAARVLGESSVFLSLAKLEGLGLPALEAMSAGCIVVGFHGLGGSEFATSRNGFWCSDGDILQCVDQIQFALSILGTNTAREIINNGMKTATLYGLEPFKTQLVGFWLSVLNSE